MVSPYSPHPSAVTTTTAPSITADQYSRRLRILYLMEGFASGGAERRFLRMAAAIDRQRFQPYLGILQAGGPLEPLACSLDIPIVSFARKSRFDLSPILWLRRFLSKEQIEVVHAMHWLSNLFAEVAALTLPEVGVVGSTVGPIYEVTRAGRLRLSVDRLLWRRMDMMTANAQAMAAYAVRQGFPSDMLAVVLNGVDLPDDAHCSPAMRIAARERLGVAPDALLVGMIARLNPVKDYPTFLRAAQLVVQRNPAARFAVIGGGPERAALESLADELGIRGAVVFTGELSLVATVLPALDVAVLCSLHEGLPNALLEAGSWGLPLVATPVGGTPEIVLDGQTGYLTPVGDAEALAAHLLALLADPLQRQALGRAAREHISQHFSMTAMMSAYEAVYQQVAEKRQARGNRSHRKKQ